MGIRMHWQKWLLALLVAGVSVRAGSAQTTAQNRPDAADSVGGKEPFDRLESLGFATTGAYPTFVAAVIESRGCDFTPNAEFLELVKPAVVKASLRGRKPVRAAHDS